MEERVHGAVLRGIDGGMRSVSSEALDGDSFYEEDFQDLDSGEVAVLDEGARSFQQLSFDELFTGVEREWQDQALCAQTDPEAFFPEKGGSTREAKRICRACGVRDECLEYALVHDERFGIWGGLSERERRRLKKQLG